MDRKVVEASAQPVVPAQIAEAKIQQGGQNFKAKISNEGPPEAAPHPRTHSAPGHTCQAKAVPPRRISWLPLQAKLVCRILRETETEETWECVWTSPPCSFARALELGTACSIDAKPSATRERCSSGSTTGAGLSPLTAKSESGKGDAHRLAPTEAQALGVSKDAVQAWLPELHAWLLLKPVHPALDAPTAEADETRWNTQKEKTTDSQRSTVQATRAAGRKTGWEKTVGGGETSRGSAGGRSCPVANAASQRTRRHGRRNERAKLRRTKPATRGAESCAKKNAKARTLRRAGKSGEPETPDASPTQTPGPARTRGRPGERQEKESPELSCAPKRKRKKARKERKRKNAKEARKKKNLARAWRITKADWRRPTRFPRGRGPQSLLAPGLIGLVLAGASPTAAEATHGLLLSQTDFNQTDGEKGKHLKTKNVDRLLTSVSLSLSLFPFF